MLDQGKRAIVHIVATCETDARVSVKVALTQAGAAGSENASAECTGVLFEFAVEIRARGNSHFMAGPATVDAEATIKDHGDHGDQHWARVVTVQFTAP